MRRETFHTPGALTLELRVPSGEIALESIDGEETIVELDITGFGNDTQELLENTRIELRQRGDGHEVLVDIPRKRRGMGLIFDRADYRLRVTAPHGADVDISTASADVERPRPLRRSRRRGRIGGRPLCRARRARRA